MNKHKRICVEIGGVFYESLNCAGKVIGVTHSIIKRRCLSNKFPNYKIVPFRVIYTGKVCTKCGEIKLLKEFRKGVTYKDGHINQCKQCRAIYNKKWDTDNEERLKEHRESEAVRNRRNKRRRERSQTDPAYKINKNISSAMGRSLKGMKGGRHWETLVGYTLEELMAHLESKFTEGMSWDNYGHGKYKWNVDHIIAKVKFNITSNTCQKFKDCWALDNLQPLWQTRNFEKGNKPMEAKYLIKPF